MGKLKLFLTTTIAVLLLNTGIVLAKWVPDDEGNLHWWEPPEQPLNYERFFRRGSPRASAQTNAQLFFLMDTSGSMDDEFDVLCDRIDQIVQGLQAIIKLDWTILGIKDTRNCTINTVHSLAQNPTVDDYEDWGPAVEDMSYDIWKSGYVRILIPISDESAENGDDWYSDDDAAIDRAKEACRANNVGVIPVIGTPGDESQYQHIINGATELANYCWGSVFLSDADNATLIEGIINAINQLVSPISEKVEVDIYVDDAFEDTISRVNKIRGDIAYLVARVTNGDSASFTGDLKVTFPNNWRLVSQNPVMKRTDMAAIENPLNVETYSQDVRGEVIIRNIPISQNGRTDQYLVKVILGNTGETTGLKEVKAEISSSVPNVFSASSDTFSINVKKRGDLIITNRNRLYHHHSSNVTVNDMLKYMVRIAERRGAVIFYADWWDEYDDFATLDGQTLNPTGNPIKDWDRTSLDYANNSEVVLNNVANAIDNYTHYWADQLGGKKNDHYLLIVGDDKVIPFHRVQDPTGDAKSKNSSWYGITDELLRAATANYIFTDAKYADTNGNKWEKGKVDNMYVGRVLGQDAANTFKFLENIWDDMVSPPENDNVIVSLITDDFGKLDLPNEMFGEEVGYVVIDKYDGKSLMDDSWRFNDIAKALREGTDYWVFYGHGNSSVGATKNAMLFRGNDLDGTVTDSDGNKKNVSDIFQRYYPHLVMMACGMGIADSGNNGVVPTDAMTYSAIRNNIAHYLGATTITNDSFNKSFVKHYIRKTTGGDDFGFNENPERLGFALNKAKNKVGVAWIIDEWNLSHLGYILYGTPWRLVNPPSQRTRQALRAERQRAKQSISSADGVLTKTLSETISGYQIVTENGFDFVSIEGYEQLEVGKQTIPVVPVKRLEIIVPDGANVSVVRSEPEDLGVLNIPVYNSFPPIFTEPPQPAQEPYVAASAGIVFDRVYYSEELNEGENIILLDLFPVSYDAATKQAKLYKRFEINITYEGTIKGVLLDAKSKKDGYALGETVAVNVAVENVTDQTQDYNATVSVEDEVGNTVQTQTEVLTVNPASIGERPIQLQPFTAGGGYWIETLVTDGVSEIGTSEQHINVDSGYIIELQAPQGFTGSVLQLTVIFQNTSNQSVESVFKVNIYQGDTKVAEFIPVTYNIPVGATEAAVFNWDIPVDFPIGQYKAVATVKTDSHSAIKSKDFVIELLPGIYLQAGSNLISLPQQPDNTAITSVLGSVIGQVKAVWTYYANGSWNGFFPDSPESSTLTEMRAGLGYWMEMKTAATLSVTGSQPVSTIMNLVPGLNLVGYTSATAKPVVDALRSIEGKYTRVEAFINGNKLVYDPANPSASTLTEMAPGYGYWIEATEAVTLDFGS
jgi:hypothetical protein